jgi:hypothetical protein
MKRKLIDRVELQLDKGIVIASVFGYPVNIYCSPNLYSIIEPYLDRRFQNIEYYKMNIISIDEKMNGITARVVPTDNEAKTQFIEIVD